MKTIIKISVFLLMLMLCGCEIKELESRDFVLEIFVDKQETYDCAVGIAEFSQEEDDSSIKITLKDNVGATIGNCLDNIDDFSSGMLYYGHTQICVISTDALKDENTLKELVDLSERNTELNRRIIILATDTFEECKKVNIYDFVQTYFSGTQKYKGRSFMIDTGRVTKQLLESQNCLIPIINVVDDEININSCAVIKDYKMCYTAQQEQAKGLLWLSDWEQAEDTVNLTYNNMPVVVRLKETKLEKIPMEDKLVVNIRAEGEIYEYSLGQNISGEDIKTQTEEQLKEKIDSALNMLQKEVNADCIGVVQEYRKNNYGVYVNNLNIDDFFGDLDVQVCVDVDFCQKGSIG